jgi:hypothetical protein
VVAVVAMDAVAAVVTVAIEAADRAQKTVVYGETDNIELIPKLKITSVSL